MKAESKKNAEQTIINLKKRCTQGFNKLKNYYRELIGSEFLQKRCNFIRMMSDLPDYGYSSEIPDGACDWVDTLFIPKQWSKKHDEKDFNLLWIRIEQLCDELGLYDEEWKIIINNYLFYNKLPNPDCFDFELFDLCKITDEIQTSKELEAFTKIKKHKDYLITLLLAIERGYKHFPITVGISPYASERDIIDFIKKNYDKIKSIQDKYKNKDIWIGKIRNKKPKIIERNKFIYKHKNLPLKKIMKLVRERFGEVLDYGHIGKIISLERQRRWYISGKRPKSYKELKELQKFKK